MLFAFNSTDDNGDYHREMYANKFENYIRHCTPLLKQGSDRPVILVIDNAPCHSRYANKKPMIVMTGTAMKAWVTQHNIPFSAQAKKKDIYLYLIMPLKKLDYNVYAVENFAQELSISILRLPPYHCDLNPFEHVWGWIKKGLRD
uniref:Tc1-like transposase DDE domain-containing protein n=1 Tax=Plectus sambesii TaxID=2011161 RepID=A0A914X1U1_9BILA